ATPRSPRLGVLGGTGASEYLASFRVVSRRQSSRLPVPGPAARARVSARRRDGGPPRGAPAAVPEGGRSKFHPFPADPAGGRRRTRGRAQGSRRLPVRGPGVGVDAGGLRR